MNIQKIYSALQEDQQNSALGILSGELEDQGYQVRIDGTPVTAEGFFEGEYPDLENKKGPLDVALYQGGSIEQEFCIEFVDFHDFIIRRKSN
ncbi:hypothetical protein [Desulfovulcanus sp.]